MNYEILLKNDELNELIDNINEKEKESLMSCHGRYHATFVVNTIENILTSLGYDERMIDKGKVAGLLHDIGCINGKKGHAESSSEMCMKYLETLDFTEEEKEEIKHAIFDHSSGDDMRTPIGAALLIADKTDLSKDRVVGIGFNDTWHKNLCEVEKVDVIVSDGLFIIDYTTTDKFSKEVFENGWKKGILMPVKGSKYFDCDCIFRINGKEVTFN